MMELRTVNTPRIPVQVLEGGKGPDLVLLHDAGGITVDHPFLQALAQRFHVHAPLLPGYGDSEEAPHIRDMLDVTLHSFDVIEALGLRRPTLVRQPQSNSEKQPTRAPLENLSDNSHMKSKEPALLGKEQPIDTETSEGSLHRNKDRE